MSIINMSITELSQGLRNGSFSSVELTKAYLSEIEKSDKEINAFLTVCHDSALAQAEKADKLIRSGKATALTGIPFALKDNICTKGIRTTCGSRMLSDFIPPYESSVSAKLSSEGAVLLGKTNMDEFAMGSSCENSAFKPVKNPLNTDYVPGGSSGGSAAAVCAHECAFSLGSDTGGSIRQPASFCGVVGMKPSYGTVSRYGLVAFASSLDQIGPITSTVRDNALILSAIAGYDSKDSSSARLEQIDFSSDIGKDIKGLKIAIVRELISDGISSEVKSSVLSAADKLSRAGAEITEVNMSILRYALPAYYIISSAEASSNLARFDGIRYGLRSSGYSDINELYKKSRSEGFGSEVKRRIMLGTFVLSSGYYDAYYKKASQVRTMLINSFNEAFEDYDLILSPTSPCTAFKLGEKSLSPLEMYSADLCTVPMSLAGLPSISLPCGIGENNLPIGIQFTGQRFSEKLIYRAAHFCETIIK